LICGNKAKSFEEGKALLLENINNGKGLKKLKEFVKAQFGDASFVDDANKFPKAKHIVEVKSTQSGIISKINAEEFGLIAMELGAGRETKESIIDLSVGIVLNKKRGEEVKEGDILAYIHSNDESNIEKAKNDII
ncbi:pyrimidine-nucleoside phosphorylase, partial [Clostridium perfringens]|nr:pyrimidine-nucleoside phosphorylase [Clostridium perfringens]